MGNRTGAVLLIVAASATPLAFIDAMQPSATRGEFLPISNCRSDTGLAMGHGIRLGRQEDWTARVREFASLAPGWDSYGSEVPGVAVIARACAFLDLMNADEVMPSGVAPSSEGGVEVFFVEGDRYASIEFLNSGSIVAGISSRDSAPHAWNVADDVTSLRSALEQLRGVA